MVMALVANKSDLDEKREVQSEVKSGATWFRILLFPCQCSWWTSFVENYPKALFFSILVCLAFKARVNKSSIKTSLRPALYSIFSFLSRKSLSQWQDGEQFAQENGMFFMETSAKKAQNVNELFYEIGEPGDYLIRAKSLQCHRTYEILSISAVCSKETGKSQSIKTEGYYTKQRVTRSKEKAPLLLRMKLWI